MDPRDLVRRLCNALLTAERAVRTLAPLGYQALDDPNSGVTSEKLVAETALLLLASYPVTSQFPEVGPLIRQVAELLAPHARNEQVAIGLCVRPALALDIGFVHVCLSRLGFPDVKMDQLLRLSLEAEAERSAERPPHRMLEQAWLRRLWNPAQTRPSEDFRIARLSILGQPADILSASRDDVYSFTHAVMYLSDLGRRKARLPRPKGEILADAEAFLACSLDQQDYDLCGELLLAWPYLGVRWSTAATFAFHVLTRVEDIVGFLPAPLTRIDTYRSLGAEERPRYAMATAYHTAYVMGLLCAACLQPGGSPPPGIPAVRDAGRARGLLPLIPVASEARHWQDDFLELAPASQEALAPFLMTVALKRAATARDMAQVRTLLAYGLDSTLVNYPVIRLAATLLRCSSVMGQLITGPGISPNNTRADLAPVRD